MAVSLKQFLGKKYPDLTHKILVGSFLTTVMKKVMDRLVKDLERIADARIVEGELIGKMTFTYHQTEDKTFILKPSDPILFKKLEWGEFNPDGSYKTPPHSLLKELKVYIRL